MYLKTRNASSWYKAVVYAVLTPERGFCSSEHITTLCFLFPEILDRSVVVKFGRQGSSDGGAILLTAADRRLGLTTRLAACLEDERQPGKIHHEMHELLTQRVMAIACGYEDANDNQESSCA